MIDRLDIGEIDQFVAACDAAGGVEAYFGGRLPASFDFRYTTIVDQNLDPFSEEYVSQQLALYEEISGRSIDQSTGELADVTPLDKIGTPNPYGSNDIAFIAKHARAVLSALVAANVPAGAHVLDMGSGWGLSSELMAFCGARVTSVDINPEFVELNRRRAARLQLPIEAILSSFDTFETNLQFDLVLFYECLHHAIRPWQTLARVRSFLKPGGKVAFAGEPINQIWKNWGLRTEPLSLYCIRKWGWFESGWSESFLRTAFEQAGLELHLAPTIGLDNGLVGIATCKGHAHTQDFTIAAPYMHLAQNFHDLSARHLELASRESKK